MVKNLPPFYYVQNDNVECLPAWAYFFLGLGYELSGLPNDTWRIVASLALPTRAFASSFTATGFVLGKVEDKSPVDSMQAQFILSLKPGTSVYIRTDKNKKLRGIVKKFVEFNNKQYISIRTTNMEVRSFSIDEYASRITIAEREVNLPKYQQSGYSIEIPSHFLQNCLSDELALKHILNSSFDVLLVGRKKVIESEVNKFCFSCKKGNKFATGCMQEILRVRQFSGANKSYRSQCIPSSSIASKSEIGEQVPSVVIFDGAVAYIKLGHKWRSSHQIVLLDRTERQFDEAVELLNQNYSYRLEDVSNLPIHIPNGVEMMVYKDSI